MTHRTAMIYAALTLAGCLDAPALGTDESPLEQTTDGEPVEPSYTNFCRTVTVTGNVYYNDLREHGRFDLRDREPTGGFSSEIQDNPYAYGSEPYGTGDNANYYGLRDAQVDIYETDVNFGTGASCFTTQWMGTTTIDRDGSFTWTGDVCETCAADLDGGQNEDLSVSIKVSLRYCDASRCFSLRDPGGSGTSHHFDDDWDGVTWNRWLSGASTTAPKRFGGTNAPVGSYHFEDPNQPTGRTAKATNVFASLVDVTRKVHVQLDIPFGKPEVKAYFPSVFGTHSHESGRICVEDEGSTIWEDGWGPLHEYGHLLHFWAWDGHGKWVSYCYNDPTCDESGSTEEYANAAFKEGWADFVAGATLNGTHSEGGCDRHEVSPTQACPDGVCTASQRYIDDVMYALCDVWDGNDECRQRGSGFYCDNTNLTLLEMWHGLQDVWDHADADGRELVEDATETHPVGLTTFGVCTLMNELADSDVGLGTTLAASGLACDL